jgi:hypothetical protein
LSSPALPPPQVFYANIAVVGTWPPGEERTFYFFSAYASTAGDRFACLPFRAGNAGLVCSGFVNKHSESEGLVAIKIRNAAAYDLPAWETSHRFGIQVGP